LCVWVCAHASCFIIMASCVTMLGAPPCACGTLMGSRDARIRSHHHASASSSSHQNGGPLPVARHLIIISQTYHHSIVIISQTSHQSDIRHIIIIISQISHHDHRHHHRHLRNRGHSEACLDRAVSCTGFGRMATAPACPPPASRRAPRQLPSSFQAASRQLSRQLPGSFQAASRQLPGSFQAASHARLTDRRAHRTGPDQTRAWA
jgi:hypothetical protein